MYPMMMTNCIAPFGCNPFAGFMTGYMLGYSFMQPRNLFGAMYCNPFMFAMPSVPIAPMPLFGGSVSISRRVVIPQGASSLKDENYIVQTRKETKQDNKQNVSLPVHDWAASDKKYESKFSDTKSKLFLDRVKEISRRLNCNYKDLLAVMNAESGLNPRAVNKKSGATGLIQFMPEVAEEYGTTTTDLKNMSAVQQLDYVEKYLQTVKRRAGFGIMEPLSGGQLYALVFLPGRAKREVLTQRGEKYYSWTDKYGRVHGNFVLDINKDGKITKSELDARVRKFYVA